jgi:hypothetical protein
MLTGCSTCAWRQPRRCPRWSAVSRRSRDRDNICVFAFARDAIVEIAVALDNEPAEAAGAMTAPFTVTDHLNLLNQIGGWLPRLDVGRLGAAGETECADASHQGHCDCPHRRSRTVLGDVLAKISAKCVRRAALQPNGPFEARAARSSRSRNCPLARRGGGRRSHRR